MINFVALDRALHGHDDPAELDSETRDEYNAVIAQGEVGTPEPDEADQISAWVWAELRHCEEAVGRVGERYGAGSEEQDRFIRELRALNPANEVSSTTNE